VLATLIVLLALAIAIAGCDKSSPGLVLAWRRGGSAGQAKGAFDVVAAENFWAASPPSWRATGRRCRASSSTPPQTAQLRTDPQDARTIAGAQMAIVNGIGYDNWISKFSAPARPAAASW